MDQSDGARQSKKSLRERCECGSIVLTTLSEQHLLWMVRQICERIRTDELIGTMKESIDLSQFIAERIIEIFQSVVQQDREELVVLLDQQCHAAHKKLDSLSQDNDDLMYALQGQSQKEKVFQQLEEKVDSLRLEIAKKDRQCIALQEERKRTGSSFEARAQATAILENKLAELEKQLIASNQLREKAEGEKNTAEAQVIACIEETKRIQQSIEDEFYGKLAEWSNERREVDLLHMQEVEQMTADLKRMKDKYKKAKKAIEKLNGVEGAKRDSAREWEERRQVEKIEADKHRQILIERHLQEIQEYEVQLSEQKSITKDVDKELKVYQRKVQELEGQNSRFIETVKSLEDEVNRINNHSQKVELIKIDEEDKGIIQNQLEDPIMELKQQLEEQKIQKIKLNELLEEKQSKNVWLANELKKIEDELELALHGKNTAITFVEQLKERAKEVRVAQIRKNSKLHAKVKEICAQIKMLHRENHACHEMIKVINAQWASVFTQAKSEWITQLARIGNSNRNGAADVEQKSQLKGIITSNYKESSNDNSNEKSVSFSLGTSMKQSMKQIQSSKPKQEIAEGRFGVLESKQLMPPSGLGSSSFRGNLSDTTIRSLSKGMSVGALSMVALNQLDSLKKEVTALHRSRGEDRSNSGSGKKMLQQSMKAQVPLDKTGVAAAGSTIKRNLMQFSHYEFASPSPLKPPLSHSMTSQRSLRNKQFLQIEDL